MARVNQKLNVFNRGRISKLALARTDLPRTSISAEIQSNWMPRALGSMMVRPGLQYIGAVNNSSTAVLIPFVRSSSFAALLELTSTTMQIWISDTKLTRTGSTATIANGTFSSDLSGWTSANDSGSTSFSLLNGSTGVMALMGTHYARARRRQTVTAIAGTHGLAIQIARGRVYFRAGSSSGADDYFAEAFLRPGNYSFAITSTGTFFLEFSANTEYASWVQRVAVESSGPVTVGAPWASAHLANLRWDQSADVIFTANSTYKQRRLERYSSDSWGIANYDPEDGPFRSPETGAKRLTPGGQSGDITLTSDQPLFKSGHVGALFRITSQGQSPSIAITTGNQYSDPIRVSGSSADRSFNVRIASTGFVAAVRVQRSVGSTDSFSDVAGLLWYTDVDGPVLDGLDNQIIYYRIGVGSTYTSGAPIASLSYAGGGITGVVRITAVGDSLTSSASVLIRLGSTAATELWQEGSWSDLRGYPSAVAFHEGRLWWAGKGQVIGSISDAYESFDPAEEGDAGPVNRSIASGGVDHIQYLASLGRLIVGTDVRELQAKTGSLDDPLTPTNFNLRDVSSYGAGQVSPIKIDRRLIFVERSGTRVMECAYGADTLDYETVERSVLVPEIGLPSIARMAVQRQPDTRLHCVRGATDGTVAVMVSQPAENVLAWVDIESSGGVNGAIEDVAVLPGPIEDAVYYIVRREINGTTMRYLERMAQEAQARGGSSNRMADSWIVSTSTTTTITGLSHLVGASVVAWGSSKDLGPFTVSTTGTITLSQAATSVVVGLPYRAIYKSAKLAYGAPEPDTALTQVKKISHIGLVLADTHARGLEYGPSTSTVYQLPRIEAGTSVSTDAVYPVYDEESFEFPGEWDTDSRLFLIGRAPLPATVLAAVLTIDTKEKK